MELLFFGDEEINVEGAVDVIARHPFAAPFAKQNDSFRQGFRDDLVFHRPQQHRDDRDHKGDHNKQKKRRNKGQGAQLLSSQSPVEKPFERRAVGGENRARVIRHRRPSTTMMVDLAVLRRISTTTW